MSLPTQPVSRWRFLVRALRHRNYRLFFCGQSLSFVGTWMTRTVTSWLVYRLAGSAWALGYIAFLSQIPSFAFVPFTGVWLDRWDRHRALISTNTLSMLCSIVLAVLALSHHIAIWQIALISVLQGVVNAVDTPARQSFLAEMLEDPADLPNAVALNVTMVTVARLAGPAMAGLIIAAWGEGWCFAIDAVSYATVILSLVLMQIAVSAHRRRQNGNMWRELTEGLAYVSRSVPLRTLLLLLAVFSVVGMPYAALLPIFAKQILHGGPRTLGFLMSAAGIGSVIAAVGLAANRSIANLSRSIGYTAVLFSASILVFALSRNLALSVAMLLVAGFAMMHLSAAINTILQVISEPDKRGRVMGYFTMAFMGMTPFASLLGGAIAERVGAPRALLLSGLFCAASAAVYFAVLPVLGPALRAIYLQLGMLPHPASTQEPQIALARKSK